MLKCWKLIENSITFIVSLFYPITEYKIFQHHMWYAENPDEAISLADIITHTISKREIKSDDSLMDRGANGTLIGDDARIIGRPSIPRFVNASGITPHQLTHIPIVIAASYCKSQRGGIILIFNEAAHKGTGNSVISCIQVEAHCKKVDERASRF